MRVTKDILWPGTYAAPQGTLHATPARVRRWASKVNAMRARGIKLPVCWGHHADALPQEGATLSSRQEDAARWNAGYIDSASLDGDRLRLVMDVPAVDEVDEDGNLLTWQQLPDGTKVRCAIGEVSASIRDWRDGTGREWPDSIVHVALTPLPVVAGQGGFRPEESPSRAGEWHLSLACLDLATGADMADKPEDDDKDMDTDEAPEADMDRDGTPDAADPDADGDGVPDVTEGGPSVAHAQQLTQVLEVLKMHGLSMPSGTTMDNLFERILVAGHAVASVGATPKPAVEPEPVTPEPEPEPEPDTNQQPETEEQRPIMMSTLSEREQALLAEVREERRQKLLARLDRLKGRVPAFELEKLREKLSGFTLSLDTAGRAVSGEAARQVEFELSCWEKVVKAAPPAGPVRGKRVPRPDEQTGQRSEADVRREAHKRAEALSRSR